MRGVMEFQLTDGCRNLFSFSALSPLRFAAPKSLFYLLIFSFLRFIKCHVRVLTFSPSPSSPARSMPCYNVSPVGVSAGRGVL
jgi:hypothetical protein